MGSNKNQTSTSSQTYGPPSYIQNAYQGLLSTAQGVASTGYNPATNKQVAGLTPQQQQAFAGVSANQGVANPYISQATNYANQAAGPISASNIRNYENPYQSDVINSTLANINANNTQQRLGLQSSAAGAGAFGGDREAVMQGELARQQNLATNQTLAGLNQSNYTQALGAAQQDASRQGQAAYTLGNLGQEAQNTAYTDTGQLAQAGATQQQQQQNEFNAGTSNAQQQSQYPFQTAQWLAGIETGLGSTAGGTSNGTTTTPGPNVGSQLLGAGLTAASFLSRGGAVEGQNDNGFDNLAAKLHHAVHAVKKHAGVNVVHVIHHRADGGGVDFSDIGSAADIEESLGGDNDPSGGSYFSSGQQKAMQGLGKQLATVQPKAKAAPTQQQQHSAGASGIKMVTPYSSSGFADGGDVDDGVYRLDAPATLDDGVYRPDSDDAGVQPVDTQPRGLRNNNPGNIEYGSFAKSHGATGSDGRFAVFPSMDNGNTAMGSLLSDYQNKHGLNTVEGIVGRWAPAGENNVNAYAGYVAKNMGVDPKAPIDVNDPQTKAKLVQAMSSYENGTKAGTGGMTASVSNPGLATPPQHDNGTIGSRVSSALGLDALPSLGLSDNGRMALRTAGLGMMASKSPFFGQAVGEGGLAGVKNYQDQELRQQEIAAKAQQLSQQAREHQTTAGETARHNMATEGLLKNQYMGGQGLDADGKLVAGSYSKNPEDGTPVFHPGMVMTGRSGTGKQSVFDAKQQAWMSVHPGDSQGALDYASGRRAMGDAEITKASILAAQADGKNIGLFGKKYEDFVKQKTEEYKHAFKGDAQPAAPAQSQTPAQATPQPQGPSWWERHAPEAIGGQSTPQTVPNPFQATPQQAAPQQAQTPAPAKPQPLPPGQTPQMALEEARRLIASGKKDPALIAQRLQSFGIDPRLLSASPAIPQMPQAQ